MGVADDGCRWLRYHQFNNTFILEQALLKRRSQIISLGKAPRLDGPDNLFDR